MATGADARIRLTDAWKQPGAASVKSLALHPELLDLLQVCYGRRPFVFQTLNFPVGSNQAVHSDATHFHSEPQGFMCGVWIALEDVMPEAGPLVYYPGSHRLPYVSAGDLGLSPEQVQAEEHKQRFFEPYWHQQIQARGFERQLLLARKGDVLIWHAICCTGIKVDNHQCTVGARWCMCCLRVLICRADAELRLGRTCYRRRRDLATEQSRPNVCDRLVAQLPTQSFPSFTQGKAPLDLTGQPLIDRPDFGALAEAGQFGPFQALAIQLRANGYGFLSIDDSAWLPLLDQVRQQLEPHVDLEQLAAGVLEPIRFQDAWLHQKLESVRTACHPEILAACRCFTVAEHFHFRPSISQMAPLSISTVMRCTSIPSRMVLCVAFGWHSKTSVRRVGRWFISLAAIACHISRPEISVSVMPM